MTIDFRSVPGDTDVILAIIAEKRTSLEVLGIASIGDGLRIHDYQGMAVLVRVSEVLNTTNHRPGPPRSRVRIHRVNKQGEPV